MPRQKPDWARANRLRHEMSKSEQRMWLFLRGDQMGVRFRRQYPVSPFVLDFYCPELKLNIEVDAEQHDPTEEKGAYGLLWERSATTRPAMWSRNSWSRSSSQTSRLGMRHISIPLQADGYTAILFPGAGGAAKLAEFQDTGNAFIAAQAAQVAAEFAAKNATVAKNAAKQAWLDSAKAYNNEWQLSPLVTETIKSKMQLPVRTGPGSITAPVTPTDVIVTPNANGTVDVKWKRNGNSSATTFIIEQQSGSTWSGVFAATTTKAHMSGFAPGVPATFRIRAVKGQMSSAPTPTFSIYSGEEGMALKIAA